MEVFTATGLTEGSTVVRLESRLPAWLLKQARSHLQRYTRHAQFPGCDVSYVREMRQPICAAAVRLPRARGEGRETTQSPSADSA